MNITFYLYSVQFCTAAVWVRADSLCSVSISFHFSLRASLEAAPTSCRAEADQQQVLRGPQLLGQRADQLPDGGGHGGADGCVGVVAAVDFEQNWEQEPGQTSEIRRNAMTSLWPQSIFTEHVKMDASLTFIVALDWLALLQLLLSRAELPQKDFVLREKLHPLGVITKQQE